MAKVKGKRWLKWLLIILGVIILAVAAFLIAKPIIDNAKYGTKEYNTEETTDGISIKVNSIERAPMLDEKCQERIVLFGNKENYDCLIINVTVTNTTDETYDYSYRNFGYRDPRSDKLLSTAITLISFKGVDVTKELKPGESHSQEVHLSVRNTVNVSDLQLIYRVDPKAEDGAEISLQL
jgi:hypothetical protein